MSTFFLQKTREFFESSFFLAFYKVLEYFISYESGKKEESIWVKI